MKSRFLIYSLSFCIVFFLVTLEDVESLLFSQYTLMQVVFAVSWPIPYKNPMRKLFFNAGFQFNFGEPFNLTSFYNATYFQNPFNSRSNVEGDNYGKAVGNTTEHMDSTTLKPNILNGETRGYSESTIKGSDLTAAQLYESIEKNLIEVGYDKTCLLKSICELARHPFHNDDAEEHLVREIIHFILTPTEHDGFAKHEAYERSKYETAQAIGESGDDCHNIYADCENSILDRISYLIP